jgi:lipoic acid synthetase
VARWWEPHHFEEWKRFGEEVAGIDHVESSPLTRSSYHAASAAVSVGDHTAESTAVAG